MRSRDKKLNWLAVAKTLADMGAGLGAGGPGGAWGQNLQGTISNLAQGIEAEKQAEEAEKKKKGASVGRIVGTLASLGAAPFTGGMSLAGASALTGLAGAAGSAAGQAIGGGDVDMGQVLTSGATSALSGGLGAAAGAGKEVANTATTGTQTVATAVPSTPAPAPNVVEGAIQNTLNPAGPQRNLLQDAMTAPPPAPVMSAPASVSPIVPRYTSPMPAQKPVSNIVPSTPTINEPTLIQRFTNMAQGFNTANTMFGGGYSQEPIPMYEETPKRWVYKEKYGWKGY